MGMCVIRCGGCLAILATDIFVCFGVVSCDLASCMPHDYMHASAPRATSVALALVFLGALGVASAGCEFYATVGET